MNKDTVIAVLDKYKVKYKTILAPQSGYRNEIWPVITNTNKTINLTFFKEESNAVNRINRASSVSGWLATQGLPTRTQIDPRLLQLKSLNHNRIAALFNYLPGDTIAWESYSKKHLELLGYSMAVMHNKLQDYSKPLPNIYDETTYITNAIHKYFLNKQTTQAISSKLLLKIDVKKILLLHKTILNCKNLPNQQALHMDYVRGNILYSKDKSSALSFGGLSVSGILDFEKTAYGYVGIDIGRTLAFLYVDCKYKKPSQVYKYFLKSGYYKKGLSKVRLNNNLLTNIVLYFLLYDFYKFLAHNPYESLYQNQHYVRTRIILQQFGIIKQVQVKG